MSLYNPWDGLEERGLDIFDGVSQIIVNRLLNSHYKNCLAPYASFRDMSRETIVRYYINICNRTILRKPRKVLKADYRTPQVYIDAEREIFQKVRAGESLTPYMSRKINKLYYNDDMLSHFGIHHFHLSTKSHTYISNLNSGTSELLFAIVDENYFYAIGIYNHTSWYDKDVLNVINKNWPSVLSAYKLHGIKGLSFDVESPSDVERFRKARINVMMTLDDGSIIAPPGGGVSTDKSSAKEQFALMDLERMLLRIKNYYKKRNSNIIYVFDCDGLLYIFDNTGKIFNTEIYLPYI